MNHLTASQFADRAVVDAEQTLHAASCRARNDRSAEAQNALATAEHARRVAIARAEREAGLERCAATRAAAQAEAGSAGRAHADASGAAVFASDYGHDDARERARIALEAFAVCLAAERAFAIADRDYRNAIHAIVGAA